MDLGDAELTNQETLHGYSKGISTLCNKTQDYLI